MQQTKRKRGRPPKLVSYTKVKDVIFGIASTDGQRIQLGYLMFFNGSVFDTTFGLVDVHKSWVSPHNQALDEELLRTMRNPKCKACEVLLYVVDEQAQTWLGKHLGHLTKIGTKRFFSYEGYTFYTTQRSDESCRFVRSDR